MANRDLELLVRLIADTKSIDKGVQGISGQLSKMGKTVVGLGAGLGLALGAREAIQWLGDAVDKSRELYEAQNKADVVFGEASKQVRDWAANLDAGFRLSERQATVFVGTIGTLVKPLGLAADETAQLSEELVQLGSDIASFNNVGIDEALGAISSGLAGETEPLRRFGLDLRAATVEADALRLGVGDLSKEQQRIASLTAQAGFLGITGDALRTADSAVGKTERLRVKMDNLQTKVGDMVGPWQEMFVDALLTALSNLEGISREIDRIFQGLESKSNPWEVLSPDETAVAVERLTQLAWELGQPWDELGRQVQEAGFTFNSFAEEADAIEAALGAGLFSDFASDAEKAASVAEGVASWLAKLEAAAEAAQEPVGGLGDAAGEAATVGLAHLRAFVKGAEAELRTADLQLDVSAFDNLVPDIKPQTFVNELNKELKQANVALDDFLTNPKAQAKLQAGIATMKRRTKRLMENMASTMDLGTTGGNLMTVFGASVLDKVGQAKGDVKASFDQLGLAGKGSFLSKLELPATAALKLVPDSATIRNQYRFLGILARAGFLAGLGDLSSAGGQGGGGGGQQSAFSQYGSARGGYTTTQAGMPWAGDDYVMAALRRAGVANGSLSFPRVRANVVTVP